MKSEGVGLSIGREPGDDSDELETAGLSEHQLALAAKAGLTPAEYAAEVAEILSTIEEPKPAEPWMDYGSALAMLGDPGNRYSTGLPALDEKLEGGLLRGRLIIFQGKPGIGKTMLATQVAINMAKTCAVGALYADEGIEGASVRIGQQLGVPRAEMINGKGRPEAAKRLSEGRPFFRFLDPGRDASTLEYAFESFDKLAPKELPRVMLLDSAQVIRSQNAPEKRREAISALMTAARDLTLRYQAITLMVSQVSRGAYRSKKEDERIDPLAAGLESSGIEFMADAIFHLDGNPDKDNPHVKLRCPKNRLSMNGVFSLDLMMDFPRARFLEADAAQMEHDEVVRRGREMDKMMKEITDAIQHDFPDGASTNDIEESTTIRRRDLLLAIRHGVRMGQLRKIKRPGAGGGSLYLPGTR